MAREAVTRAASERLDPDRTETLRLLVSELVTNSVRHGSRSDRVELVVAFNREVKAEITDYGDGFVPAPRATSPDDVGGWGLYLVEQLAERWGVARDTFTRVWFVVRAG